MPRYGSRYGPDITYLGVDRCALDEPDSFAGADVLVLGAPFDGARRTGREPASGRRRSA